MENQELVKLLNAGRIRTVNPMEAQVADGVKHKWESCFARVLCKIKAFNPFDLDSPGVKGWFAYAKNVNASSDLLLSDGRIVELKYVRNENASEIRNGLLQAVEYAKRYGKGVVFLVADTRKVPIDGQNVLKSSVLVDGFKHWVKESLDVDFTFIYGSLLGEGEFFNWVEL